MKVSRRARRAAKFHGVGREDVLRIANEAIVLVDQEDGRQQRFGYVSGEVFRAVVISFHPCKRIPL